MANSFLRATLVCRDIKEAILKVGFSWHPYVLWAYFDTNMIIIRFGEVTSRSHANLGSVDDVGVTKEMEM